MVLLWQQGEGSRQYFDPGLNATVRVFGSEKAMLAAWLEVVREYDADALVTFQVLHGKLCSKSAPMKIHFVLFGKYKQYCI